MPMFRSRSRTRATACGRPATPAGRCTTSCGKKPCSCTRDESAPARNPPPMPIPPECRVKNCCCKKTQPNPKCVNLKCCCQKKEPEDDSCECCYETACQSSAGADKKSSWWRKSAEPKPTKEKTCLGLGKMDSKQSKACKCCACEQPKSCCCVDKTNNQKPKDSCSSCKAKEKWEQPEMCRSILVKTKPSRVVGTQKPAKSCCCERQA
jgi:hypothetical protein